ncbi:MAG: hypothetical protein ACSLEX_00950 [Minisyncoccota bacterium]
MNTESLLLFSGFFLIFLSSQYNAQIAGYVWADTKIISGVSRLLFWIPAMISTIGFTWSAWILIPMLLGWTHPALHLTSGAILKASIIILFVSLGVMSVGIWINAILKSWREHKKNITDDEWVQVYEKHTSMNIMPLLGNIHEDFDLPFKLLLSLTLVWVYALGVGPIMSCLIIRGTAKQQAKNMLVKSQNIQEHQVTKILPNKKYDRSQNTPLFQKKCRTHLRLVVNNTTSRTK